MKIEIEKQIKALEHQNSKDTNEKGLQIHTQALKKMKEKLLFEQYLKLQSNEWKEDILDYEEFNQPGHDICIKVNFTWGWLRVYYRNDNSIEWY